MGQLIRIYVVCHSVLAAMDVSKCRDGSLFQKLRVEKVNVAGDKNKQKKKKQKQKKKTIYELSFQRNDETTMETRRETGNLSSRKPVVKPRRTGLKRSKVRLQPSSEDLRLSRHWMGGPNHRQATKEGSKVLNLTKQAFCHITSSFLDYHFNLFSLADLKSLYKQRRSRWDGSWWAISSGSTLFVILFLYWTIPCLQ